MTQEQDPSAASAEAPPALPLWCVVAAFGTYFCMYAFRKPFTAASFEGMVLAGVSFKVVLVTAQVMGYMLSKFVGIRVAAELDPRRRAGVILALIAAGELALFFFGLTPPPYNFVWLFFNGLPLGMVFGLVLGFLEGRRQTEALTAGLCASFVMADGVVKSVGARLLAWHVSEYWMPFATGALFTPALLLFVWMLSRIPAPSQPDVAARSERAPMTAKERGQFLRRYGLGLALIGAAYLLITVLRSVRADFAPEIWAGLQAEVSPDVYGWSETAVAAGALVTIALTVLVRDNRRAFLGGIGLAIAGSLLIPVALVGQSTGVLTPLPFMIVLGLGLYLPYIVVHTTVFERLIALTRDRGNIGYLMNLVDAFGYLGYVVVLLARNVFGPPKQFFQFFTGMGWVIAAAVLLFLIPCWRFFASHPAIRGAQTEAGELIPVAEAS